jgi:hypothetical protein
MKVVNAYRNFYSYVAIGNAMISQQKMEDHLITRYLKTGIYGTYYFFLKSKRLARHDLINANPDLNLAIELWNTLENKLV